MGEKVFNSIGEFHREFFPNSILSDLASKIISSLYPQSIRDQAKYRVNNDEENPRKGLIEFTKPTDHFSLLERISGTIKQVYGDYGFEVKQRRDNGLIVASKNKEVYWISIFDRNSEGAIYVTTAII